MTYEYSGARFVTHFKSGLSRKALIPVDLPAHGPEHEPNLVIYKMCLWMITDVWGDSCLLWYATAIEI